MSSHQYPRHDENLPTGGSTGLDHANTGTCPYHTTVMLAPDESCPVCAQQTRASRPPSRQPPTVTLEEILDGPTEIGPAEPHGHAAAGHYV